MIKLQHVMN
ncbi:hypothetical protein F383_38458 [Gossypium arboreum]|uniref:Uncharacterized protein n=1 Tax=Gossypium arboreum TaxID=29729 RepID=A0A0B0MJ24_GOSAR|nr:hypothetical protein F383_38458 [Gossypium arboreum]